MKIYTKSGDNLKTKTINKEVYKNDITVEVNGSIDELQAFLMVAYNYIDIKEIKEILLSICNDLYIIGYDIFSSNNSLDIKKVDTLESLIDNYDSLLKPLNEFIIPGKTKASSFINLARVNTRKCERIIVSYAINHKINYVILKYINRLSDLLFVFIRYIEEKS